MKQKLTALVFLSFLLFLPCNALAQDNEIQQLDTVEVTGSRIVASITEVPAQTYVLTRDEIEKTGARTVADALKYTPGLCTTVNDASMVQKKGLTIRGLTSEVLYLIDGIPISDPNHGTGSDLGSPLDLRSIDLDTVERIEVLKGSASAIYGSDAAGGVVNIITKGAYDKPHASTSLTGGSNEYFSTSTRAGIAEGDWRVTLGYRYTREGETRLRKRDDGNYDTANHYASSDYNFKVGYKNWSFTGFAGQNKSSWEESEFSPSPVEYEQKNTYGRYTLQYNDGNFLGRIYLSKMESVNNNDSASSPENTETSSDTYGVTLRHKTKFGVIPFSYGIDYKNDSSDYKDKVNLSSSFEKKRFEVAPYIETSLPFGLCSFDIGLRYEYWNISDGDNYKEIMPRFSLNFADDNGTIYYVTVARHFSVPTLYQMFAQSAYVTMNPNLKAEKGWDYEIGVKNMEATNPWGVNLFYMNLDDKINYVTTDPDTWQGQYRNVDKYRAVGVEANYTWNFAQDWSLSPAVSYIYAEEQNGDSAWERSDEPRWKASCILGYNKNGWKISLAGLFYADRKFGKNNDKYSNENIFTMDASISKKIKNTTLLLAVTNLFNKEYFTTGSGHINPERRFVLKLTYDL